jgi:hypothetical protein
LEKFTAEKKIKYFFDQELQFLSYRATEEAFSSQKRTSSTSDPLT